VILDRLSFLTTFSLFLCQKTLYLVSLLGFALAQDLKKRSLTEKNRPVMPVLPSHVGNRKKTDYYLLSSQVLLHPKLGS